MKKILFLISICSSVFGGVWSSLSSSGINEQYESLNHFIKQNNKEIQDYWENEIGVIIKEIEKETQIQKELITKIQELSKESLMFQTKINFLLNQESQLLSNQANIEAMKE